MKIILLKDVKKIGRKYEIKDVADGYALNSLIPNGIAVPATSSYLKVVEEKKKQSALMKEDFKKAFEFAISKLPEGKLHIDGKVNDKGHLFAGIHAEQIIEEFKKDTGVILCAEHFEMEKPIKEIGEHTVDLVVEGANYKLKIIVKPITK
ncbi:MAG: 50S ribosomal protein L9 [Candidatus Paceibacterota bacterium]|jgi:large subunit ribosomal protein L9